MARFQRGAQDASALNHPHRAIYAWPASGWGCPSSPQQLVTFVCISDRQVPIDSHFGRMILTDIPDMETTSTSREAARRSTRIRAQIPVRITVIKGSSYFSQSCHTLVVNTAGCAVRLSQPLELATAVCIDQLPNQRTAIARVANCVPLGAGRQYWLVGLALDEPENIWEIHPAPADWGTESAVALAAITATNASVPTKKGGWPYRQFSQRGEFHPAKI